MILFPQNPYGLAFTRVRKRDVIKNLGSNPIWKIKYHYARLYDPYCRVDGNEFLISFKKSPLMNKEWWSAHLFKLNTGKYDGPNMTVYI